jgi:hypothetical protein
LPTWKNQQDFLGTKIHCWKIIWFSFLNFSVLLLCHFVLLNCVRLWNYWFLTLSIQSFLLKMISSFCFSLMLIESSKFVLFSCNSIYTMQVEYNC